MRGSFGRRLTLISRADALGATPAIVAAECRAILRDEVFPQLTAAVPWLDGALALGEGTARI